MEKSHYKDFFQSGTLQDNHFDGAGDTVVFIQSIQEQILQTVEGKKPYLCATLKGYEEPFRLNKTICKAVAKALGTPNPTQWAGQYVTVYIDHKVRDPQNGGLCSCPRVRTIKPRITIDTRPAQAALRACKTLDELMKAWEGLAPAAKKEPAIIGLKNKIKSEVSK